MTEIKVLGSSSDANGYVLISGGHALFLELGCKTSEYYNALSNNTQIDGAICSHWHGDHFNQTTVKEILRRGNFVCVGEKVLEPFSKDPVLGAIRPLKINQKVKVGQFAVQPLEVPHNVPNYGFLIITPTEERIAFVTDAMECPYNFKDLDCIMVECNHDVETIMENFFDREEGRSHPEFHLSIDDAIDFCKRNMNINLKQIIFIHLSHQNVNEEAVLKQAKDELRFQHIAVAHTNDTFVIENDNF